MLYFHLFFPPLMFLSPLLVLVGYKPIAEADPDEVRLTRRRLLVWTALAIAAYLLITVLRFTLLASATEGPGLARQAPLTQFMAFLFMPLWFACAMPYVRAARPYMDQPVTKALPVRSASLVSRRSLQVLPSWTRWAPLAVLVAGAIYCVVRGFGTSQWSTQTNVLVGALLLAGALGLNFFPSLQRFALSGKEPGIGSPDPELEKAYASFRRAKSWGVWTLATGFEVLTAGIAALLVSGLLQGQDTGRMIGLIGGTGGALIGTLGGLYGAWLGVCGSRVNELLNQRAAKEA